MPRSVKRRPDPETKSLMVGDTSTSPGSASAEMPEAMRTAIPCTSLSATSTSADPAGVKGFQNGGLDRNHVRSTGMEATADLNVERKHHVEVAVPKLPKPTASLRFRQGEWPPPARAVAKRGSIDELPRRGDVRRALLALGEPPRIEGRSMTPSALGADERQRNI